MTSQSEGNYTPEPVAFQIFGRKNDRNGNPYRLIFFYGPKGQIVGMTEARSSSPNCAWNARRSGMQELPSAKVSVKEYNRLKRFARVLPQGGVIEADY